MARVVKEWRPFGLAGVALAWLNNHAMCLICQTRIVIYFSPGKRKARLMAGFNWSSRRAAGIFSIFEGAETMKRILAVALLLPALASAQIYKCTGPDGKVNFTDSPCADHEKAQGLAIDPVTQARQAEAARSAAVSARVDGYLAERAEMYKQRRLSAGLRIGMTQREVIASPIWGYPDDSNTTSTPYGKREQWIYEVDEENEFERTYIYFDDEVLTAIQD